MDYKEHLYYGLGHIVYAIAAADGKVQLEEKQKLEEIINEEMQKHNYTYDVTEIIFKLLDKEHGILDAYKIGIKEMSLGSHHLDADLKEQFLCILRRVAAAFPPITDEEGEVIYNFEEDIQKM